MIELNKKTTKIELFNTVYTMVKTLDTKHFKDHFKYIHVSDGFIHATDDKQLVMYPNNHEWKNGYYDAVRCTKTVIQLIERPDINSEYPDLTFFKKGWTKSLKFELEIDADNPTDSVIEIYLRTGAPIQQKYIEALTTISKNWDILDGDGPSRPVFMRSGETLVCIMPFLFKPLMPGEIHKSVKDMMTIGDIV